MSRATMNATGRLTLPAEARRALGLDGETDFEVEIDHERDAIVLRPAVLLAREDAWAYTPEHRARLAESHADVRAGRVYKIGRSDLEPLVEHPELLPALLKKLERRARRVSDA